LRLVAVALADDAAIAQLAVLVVAAVDRAAQRHLQAVDVVGDAGRGAVLVDQRAADDGRGQIRGTRTLCVEPGPGFEQDAGVARRVEPQLEVALAIGAGGLAVAVELAVAGAQPAGQLVHVPV